MSIHYSLHYIPQRLDKGIIEQKTHGISNGLSKAGDSEHGAQLVGPLQVGHRSRVPLARR